MGKQAETARVTFSEIEEAFFFVNSAEMGMHSAVLHRPTGQVYFSSEIGDMDEISAADLDWDVCIDIPHKNELDLGLIMRMDTPGDRTDRAPFGAATDP